MSNAEKEYLKLFTPTTHGVEIPPRIAAPMEAKGWIRWLPPVFGTKMWGITDVGRAALNSIKDE